MNYPTIEHFLCDYDLLLRRIDEIDLIGYHKSRNFLNGPVTWLSPFITHGIIDTSVVAKRLLSQHSAQSCTKLLFELAWREYFHRVWQRHGDAIFSDMRPPADEYVANELNHNPPSALIAAQTGIDVVDDSLHHLFNNGLMHNHARLWTASLACNVGKTHWLEPAKWLHYHLLDGDLASNTLSWQWVAGTFSNKRYLANQDNINKYSNQIQQGTFLDQSYELIAGMAVPDHFSERSTMQYDISIPADPLKIDATSVAIRSLWNLDSLWQPDAELNILFIDQAHYEQWPMSEKRWRFIQHWVAQLPELKIMCGTVEQLKAACAGRRVYCREYPACVGWSDECDSRSWLYHEPAKNYNSFFAFWKQVCGDVGLTK